jgi:hypothetical protein
MRSVAGAPQDERGVARPPDCDVRCAWCNLRPRSIVAPVSSAAPLTVVRSSVVTAPDPVASTSGATPSEHGGVVPPTFAASARVGSTLSLAVLEALVRVACVLLMVAAAAGLASAGLAVTHEVPEAVASGMQADCLRFGVLAAALAMSAASVRAGAIERRRQILRERFRLAAEHARREAFRAREAARLAALEREAAEAQARAAARAEAEEQARVLAAAVEAASPAPTPEEQEALIERALAERERREREERIDRAIRDGTRAA